MNRVTIALYSFLFAHSMGAFAEGVQQHKQETRSEYWYGLGSDLVKAFLFAGVPVASLQAKYVDCTSDFGCEAGAFIEGKYCKKGFSFWQDFTFKNIPFKYQSKKYQNEKKKAVKSISLNASLATLVAFDRIRRQNGHGGIPVLGDIVSFFTSYVPDWLSVDLRF